MRHCSRRVHAPAVWPGMETHVLLDVLLETSHHDGHCSGSECEYVPVQRQVIMRKQAGMTADSLVGMDLSSAFDSLAVCTGSGACEVSKLAADRGMGQHQVRASVLAVKPVVLL